jgi:hypothetical protein
MLPQAGLITGTGSTFVLPADDRRNYTILVNQLDSEVYLGIGTGAVLGHGILLTTIGSSYELNKDNHCAAEINAIGTNQMLRISYQLW